MSNELLCVQTIFRTILQLVKSAKLNRPPFLSRNPKAASTSSTSHGDAKAGSTIHAARPSWPFLPPYLSRDEQHGLETYLDIPSRKTEHVLLVYYTL